jgi:hypothetical protein
VGVTPGPAGVVAAGPGGARVESPDAPAIVTRGPEVVGAS